MTRINLLPWREERAERRRRYFLLFLLASAGVALAAVWLADRIIDQAIDRQVARNNHLSKEVTVLDSRIKAIDELREQRRQLMARMKVVEDLQGDRSNGAQLFDQLARSMPDGVQLREVTVSSTTVEISGTAASNQDVARLMRNLETTKGLSSPSLKQVRADETGNAFQLTVGHGVSHEAAQ